MMVPDLAQLSDEDLYRALMAAKAAAGPDLLRDPATMAHGLDPQYQPRPHLRVVSDALTGLELGEYDRLLVTTPPQVGKSYLTSEWFPLWWLALHPMDRVVVGSYADSLAHRRGKKVRGLIEEHGGEFGLTIQRGSSSMQDWGVSAGGGMRSVGVGAGLTGHSANCLFGEAIIDTTHGPMSIGSYVDFGCSYPVLAYDHAEKRSVWADVIATSVSKKRVIEVVTAKGRSIRCTPDHQFFVPGRGYVPARDLAPGDPLLRAKGKPEPGMPPVRGSGGATLGRTREKVQEGGLGSLLQPGLPEPFLDSAEKAVPHLRKSGPPSERVLRHGVSQSGSVFDDGLRLLREGVHDSPVRAREARATGSEVVHVLDRVPRGASLSTNDEGVRGLRCSDAQQPVVGIPVLHGGMQGQKLWELGTEEASRAELPSLPNHLPAEEFPTAILFEAVRGRRARAQDDRGEELQVQKRPVICSGVPADASTDHGTRRAPLRGMQGTRVLRHDHLEGKGSQEEHLRDSPHQRGRGEQPATESGDTVQGMPCDPPQVGCDAVAMVRPVRGEEVRVYDLQVARTNNFFAEEVLVHNCVIIDDPHKDRSEADSARIRQGVHDWYSSTLLTRLQPDRSAVVIVQTRWHDDDLAGRRLKEEGRLEEGGRWKVVHLPAIADSKFGPDPLGRAPGEPLTHPKIPTADVEARRRWWADKRGSVAPRDWHALYQGDPQPDEGTLLPKGMLNARTHNPPPVTPIKTGIAVDPSGGGRDTAGIIGGFLGTDQRLYLTHDRSVTGPSEAWGRATCELAAEIDADFIVVEANYGGDMTTTIIRLAWDRLTRDNPNDPRYRRLVPRVRTVHAKKGKLLRAEPIAQQISDDRMRLGAYLPLLVHEWEHWQSTDPDSPGRIDASVYLGYDLLPVPGSGAVISTPTSARINRAHSGGGTGGGGGAGPRINRHRGGRR